MGLTGSLLRIAATRPHVLVVGVPGQISTRLSVEAEIARRVWPVAGSPADADLLVVAGNIGPQLSAVVETVWGQIPAPRARVTITTTSELADALDAGVRELAAVTAQRRDPDHPPSVPTVDQERADGDTAHGDPQTSDGQQMHHMPGGAMEMPGDIPMADLGKDRDGLMLDALHVPVGPLLADWPGWCCGSYCRAT